MPNWCMNELEVMGDPVELKRFVESNMGLPATYPPLPGEKEPRKKPTTPYFCFNALIPTPKEVLEIGFDAHRIIPELSKEYAFRGQTRYPIDGYHWDVANWGTKWDIYYDAITAETMGWHEGADHICFSFETAWSPPLYWLETVARLFPSLYFKLHYEEPGCFYAGDFYAAGVDCLLDEYSDTRCKNLFSWMLEGADEQVTEAM